ncbi:MAG: hypothetical protein K8S25_09280 [Alphaproteobacteria bacterium]|nr:hypothetical protein [Alphaproteobacteria bacterium]
MSDPDKPADADPPKREILNPGDSAQSLSGDPSDRAEAHARAARQVLEEQERKRREETARNLGWHGRLWQRIKALFDNRLKPRLAAVYDVFADKFPRAAKFVGGGAYVVARLWLTVVWPFINRVSHRTSKSGERRLSWLGKALIASVVLVAVWPVFKIYYVLGTTRDFHNVQITFKQIISHDRYLVFGDYVHGDDGAIDNMAFNVTDSWVYWNWTPDLMFAQVPVVGKCNFRTYGWYIRVPRFIPFLGRTLLVEPIIISAHCQGYDGLPTGPQS